MLKRHLSLICAAAAVAALGCGDDIYPMPPEADAGSDAAIEPPSSATATSPRASAPVTSEPSASAEDGGVEPGPAASSAPTGDVPDASSAPIGDAPDASGAPTHEPPDAAPSATEAPTAAPSVSEAPDTGTTPDADLPDDGGVDESDAATDAGDGGSDATIPLPTSTGGGGPIASESATPSASDAPSSAPTVIEPPDAATTSVADAGGGADAGITSDAGSTPSAAVDAALTADLDAAPTASATPDASALPGSPDSGSPDADVGLPTPDASVPDAPDSGDAGAGDASAADAGSWDAGSWDAGDASDPVDAAPDFDTDQDSFPDSIDTDDDNDGVLDTDEINGVLGPVVVQSDFDSLTGGGVGSQYDTGLTIFAGPSFSDWSALTNVHGVELASGNFAATFYDTNSIELNANFDFNRSGVTYQVAFDGGPSVWAYPSQVTRFGDGLVFEVLNASDQVVYTYNYFPPVWSGTQSLAPVSFTFVGDGSGDVRIGIHDNAIGDSFGGAVDNLVVRPISVSDPLDPSSCGDADGDGCDDCAGSCI